MKVDMKVDMKGELAPQNKIGRPRAFKENDALKAAMLLFWKHGYETTSMALLSKKMKMNAPSIYAAFGDKKSLFLKALDLYVGDLDDIKTFIDSAPTAREAAEQLLKRSAVRFTDKHTPHGCMLASAVASGSSESADLQVVAAEIRLKIEGFLKDRIQYDIERKKLAKRTSAAGLAGLTIATVQGMSVLARDGASLAKLLLIAEISLQSWVDLKEL